MRAVALLGLRSWKVTNTTTTTMFSFNFSPSILAKFTEMELEIVENDDNHGA